MREMIRWEQKLQNLKLLIEYRIKCRGRNWSPRNQLAGYWNNVLWGLLVGWGIFQMVWPCGLPSASTTLDPINDPLHHIARNASSFNSQLKYHLFEVSLPDTWSVLVPPPYFQSMLSRNSSHWFIHLLFSLLNCELSKARNHISLFPGI